MAYEHRYPNRKDWRAPYPKRQQRCDTSCRPHGSCKVCQGSRLYQDTKARQRAAEQLREYEATDAGDTAQR